jgi:hypothetical protein
MGFFCRSNVPVDLVRWVPEEATSRTKISIADIDVLGLKYDIDLERRLTIVEGKTGDLKPADRILWVRGLMDYVKADDAYLVALKEEESFAEVSRLLGIQLLNEAKMTELEKSLGIDEGYVGPFDPFLFAKRVEFYAELKKSRARKPLYFVTFRAWEENLPHLSLKSVIGQGKNLSEALGSKLAYNEAEIWLANELLVVFSVALLNYSAMFRGISYADTSRFEAEIKRTISHGRLNPYEMNQLTSLFYDLMKTYVKTKFGRDLDINKEDLFDIEPAYAVDLADTVFRILNSPLESKEVVRAMDVLTSLGEGQSEEGVVKKLLPNVDVPKVTKMAENNARLFCKATGLVPELYSKIGLRQL